VIFLLSNDRIRYEVVELTRYRIAQALRIAPTDVEVKFETDEKGEVARGWVIKALPKGVTPERAREAAIAIGRYINANFLLPRLTAIQESARDARKRIHGA
jgi:hypothetical protein